MGNEIFISIKNMVDYILDIRWYELPKNLLFIGVIIGIGYCAALIVIGFPCSIIEAIIKRKLNEGVVSKIITVVSVCFIIVFLLELFS